MVLVVVNFVNISHGSDIRWPRKFSFSPTMNVVNKCLIKCISPYISSIALCVIILRCVGKEIAYVKLQLYVLNFYDGVIRYEQHITDNFCYAKSLQLSMCHFHCAALFLDARWLPQCRKYCRKRFRRDCDALRQEMY